MMGIVGGAGGLCGTAERKADVRVIAAALPAAIANRASIVISLVALGRLSIAPTHGVAGHGTGMAGTLAVPPSRCAASVVELPSPCARSGTPPLKLLAVTVVVLAGGIPRSPEHDVSARVAVDGEAPLCNADPDWVGKPRPLVPSPVVPRLLVPRAATPLLLVFSGMFALGAVELPKLDDVDEEELAAGGVVSLALGSLMTPEVLTEMHGGDVSLAAPMGIPDVVKVFAELPAPPAKVGSAVSQGGALPALANGAVAPETSPISGPSGDVAAIPPVFTVPLCAELSVVRPKSAPSGDVAAMPLGVCIVVCAQLSPTPSVVMARIKAAER